MLTRRTTTWQTRATSSGTTAIHSGRVSATEGFSCIDYFCDVFVCSKEQRQYDNEARGSGQAYPLMRQNGYPSMNSNNSNKQQHHMQQQQQNYQYDDNRYITENANNTINRKQTNSYMDMPRANQGFDMPIQQQNGFYNQRNDEYQADNGQVGAAPGVILGERLLGTVKWYNFKNGYGFITR